MPGIRARLQSLEIYKWLVLVNVCSGSFISAVDGRVMTVSMPTIALALHTDIATIQWATMVYFLVLVGLTLSFAKLGDMIGRKHLYTGGFALFTAGSALCGISTSIEQLIFFRVLQATGGAMLTANGQAIIAATFTSGDRGKALGFSAMSFHVGYLLGPSLGGFIIDYLGWRWVFYINLPFGLAATLMAYFVLKEVVERKAVKNFDILGGLLLIVSLVSLLIALNQGASYGWDSPLIKGLLGLFAVFAGAFVFVELKVAEPILDFTLFRVRLFAAAVSSVYFITLSQGVIGLLLPFYLQGVLSYAPRHVGLIIMSSSIANVIFAPLGGWLSDRFGSRALCTIGAFLSSLSLFLISTLSPSSTYGQMVFYLVISGIGWGLFSSPNSNAILGSVPRQSLGAASGTLQTVGNGGRAMGIALGGALFSIILSQYQIKLTKGMDYANWSLNPTPFVVAFQRSFLITAGLTALAVILSAVRGKSRN